MNNHSGDADDVVERERSAFFKWLRNGWHIEKHGRLPTPLEAWQARAQSATQDDGVLRELEGLAAKLKKGGASLPHFANGSTESAMEGGLSIALMLAEEIIAKYRGK